MQVKTAQIQIPILKLSFKNKSSVYAVHPGHVLQSGGSQLVDRGPKVGRKTTFIEYIIVESKT